MLLTTVLLLALQPPATVAGVVRGPDGAPLTGVLVVAHSPDRRVTHASVTGRGGRYAIQVDGPGPFQVELVDPAWRRATTDAVRPGSGSTDFSAQPVPPSERLYHSASWLGLLPDGEVKRKFILDCTGCHQFNETRALKDGAPRSAAQWAQDAARMLGFAGAASNFPVIAADRSPEATGAFVNAAVSARYPAGLTAGTAPVASAGATVTEYDLPVPQDLPHDVAVDSTGRIVITGMFSHRMFVLDPATRVVTETPIPVPQANPRAVELDSAGNWYVLLGGPRQVARYDVRAGTWKTFPIEMYPHSIVVTPDGSAAWFNGHFTKNPILIGRLDLRSGQVDRFEAPLHPVLSSQGGPVPYEQRIAPNGTVWTSELIGNRIVSFDPARRRFEAFDMPQPAMGPRRFDISRDGVLWIPAYSANALVRFDPATRRFQTIPLPVADAVPYVARVNHQTGDVWIGTAAADLVFRYTPRTSQFTAYRVATRGASMRHLTIDPRTGDVWVAYGASPAIHPSRVARVQVTEAP